MSTNSTAHSRAGRLRLEDNELERLLDDLESERVERKSAFGKGEAGKKARQAVCAFANNLPGDGRLGVLFVGVNDDGSPSGLAITDNLLLQLGDISRDGNILPLPTLSVERRHLKSADIAVVTVAPSDMPPVRYDGRIWVRVGPRAAHASEQDERILNERRRYRHLPFDLHPMPSATMADLSRALFEDDYLPSAFSPEVLEENNRTLEERLASCKMIVSPNEPIPTVVGLLALGKQPQRFLPGAYIQFLRIQGTALADPVADATTIVGTLAEQIRRVEDKFLAHNRSSVEIESSPTHEVTEDYPPAAFRQLLYNAVMHRVYEGTNAPIRVTWYDDRVEIANPGGPYGAVTERNFGQPGVTDYRNPNVAEVLKTYGFVQRFGRGIEVARRTLTENGNPPPIFDVSANAVTCSMHRK